jgi:hypothetical protein
LHGAIVKFRHVFNLKKDKDMQNSKLEIIKKLIRIDSKLKVQHEWLVRLLDAKIPVTSFEYQLVQQGFASISTEIDDLCNELQTEI